MVGRDGAAGDAQGGDRSDQQMVRPGAGRRRPALLASFGGDQLTMPPDKAQELFLKEINNWAEFVRIARIVPAG